MPKMLVVSFLCQQKLAIYFFSIHSYFPVQYEHLSDVNLHFRERRGLASLRYRNRPGNEHCTYVWTEFLSGMVFVPARELSGIEVWTKSLLKTFLTLVKLGQYFFARDVFLIVRLINKIELILLLNHTGPLFIN